MKHRIMAAICALLALAALSGCAQPTVFETLSLLSKKEYSAVVLEVTAAGENASLSGRYAVTAEDGGRRIEYTYDSLATVEETDEGLVFPEEAVVTKSGSMTVKDGAVVSREGDEADLPLGCLTAAGMRFSEENFTAVEEEEGRVFATLTDISAFLGGLSGTDGRLTAEYSAEGLKTVSVTFTSGGYACSLRYTFTL